MYNEYRAHPLPGSTDIHNYRESPEKVGQKLKPRGYFTLGHAWEGVLLDGAGANHGEHFDDNYFVIEGVSSIHDDILAWIKGGRKSNIEAKRKRLTAAGKPNKTNTAFFRQVDQCLANPDKTPVEQAAVTPMFKAAKSALSIPISGDYTLADYIRIGRTQVPIISNRRKCLPDLLCIFESSKQILIFDFKYIATLSKARSDLRSKWWIQACHYETCLAEVYPDYQILPMIFIAGSKSENDLFMAQKLQVESDSREAAMATYDKIFANYEKWTEAGRPLKGYFSDCEVKPFLY